MSNDFYFVIVSLGLPSSQESFNKKRISTITTKRDTTMIEDVYVSVFCSFYVMDMLWSATLKNAHRRKINVWKCCSAEDRDTHRKKKHVDNQ